MHRSTDARNRRRCSVHRFILSYLALPPGKLTPPPNKCLICFFGAVFFRANQIACTAVTYDTDLEPNC